MALFLYFAMPLHWTWYLCMLFGSILSATDPVAVVALLKDAGASPKLTILIIGESLLNDGTAMVLFTLYFELMKGHDFSGGEVMLFFLEECLGAPLLGIGMGFVGVFWMSLANNPLSPMDVTIQIVITVTTAYMVFFTAQYECEVSGVLACCAAGIVFAWQAPPLILEHETMHSVWGFIEWVGNTLIFLLAGLIIGGSSEETHISAMDYFYAVVIYVALMVIRCANMALLLPLLKRTGLQCTTEDAVFMSWAGLRGALAVALSLVVYGHNEELGMSTGDADKVFFYAGAVATLTLIVNATTAQAVLWRLGLLKDEDSAYDLSQLNNVRVRLHHELMEDLSMLETGIRFGDVISSESFCAIGYDVKTEDIVRHVTLLRDHDEAMDDTTEHLSKQLALMCRNTSMNDMVQDETGRFLHPEILAYYRTRFLESCRAKYWQYVEESKLPRNAPVTQTLLYSIDSALRRVNIDGQRDWNFLKREMKPNEVLAFLQGHAVLGNTSPVLWLHKYSETRRMYFMVYVLTSFIDAHEDTQRLFSTMVGATSDPLHRDEGSDDATSTLEFPEQRKVLGDSRASVREAKEMLGNLHGSVVSSVLVGQASRILLARQIKHIRELLEEGLLHQKLADKFLQTVSDDMKLLDAQAELEFRCVILWVHIYPCLTVTISCRKNAEITASARRSSGIDKKSTVCEEKESDVHTVNPLSIGEDA